MQCCYIYIIIIYILKYYNIVTFYFICEYNILAIYYHKNIINSIGFNIIE